MNSLLTIIIQSSISISVLYLVYYLFLRKDTFFKTNRFYLLSALLISVTVPFIDFSNLLNPSTGLYMVLLDPITITPEGMIETMRGNTSIFHTVIIVYITGMAIFSFRFIYQLLQLALLVRRYGISERQGIRIVFTDKNFSPFSFFNLIFLNNPDTDSTGTKKIIAHEMIHIKQGHSFDLIILEIITIFQWFNPFIWMYRHAIKTLHEFMADEGVLHSGVDANVYSALLFEQSTGIQISDLANNFSKSLLKRRFIMMTKKRTTNLARLKLLFVLPLALTMIMATSMSPELIAQEKKKELPPPPPKAVKNAEKPIEAPSQLSQDEPEEVVFTVVEEMPAYPGGNEAMYTYLGQNIKYPEGARKNKIQGTVYVTFIVRKDGSVSNVNILRGIGHGCDEEAIRVVKEMPLWKAGKQGGKAVNVQYNLPIKFVLEPDKKEEEKK